MSRAEQIVWAATSLPAVVVLVVAVACASGCAAVGDWDSVEVPERQEVPPCGETGACPGDGQ